MKVRWSETALAEIDEIFSYIHARNRSAASAVVKRIEGLAALLGEFPEVGHMTDEAGVRLVSVVHYPFLIFMRSTTLPTRSSSFMSGMAHANIRKPAE